MSENKDQVEPSAPMTSYAAAISASVRVCNKPVQYTVNNVTFTYDEALYVKIFGLVGFLTENKSGVYEMKISDEILENMLTQDHFKYWILGIYHTNGEENTKKMIRDFLIKLKCDPTKIESVVNATFQDKARLENLVMDDKLFKETLFKSGGLDSSNITYLKNSVDDIIKSYKGQDRIKYLRNKAIDGARLINSFIRHDAKLLQGNNQYFQEQLGFIPYKVRYKNQTPPEAEVIQPYSPVPSAPPESGVVLQASGPINIQVMGPSAPPESGVVLQASGPINIQVMGPSAPPESKVFEQQKGPTNIQVAIPFVPLASGVFEQQKGPINIQVAIPSAQIPQVSVEDQFQKFKETHKTLFNNFKTISNKYTVFRSLEENAKQQNNFALTLKIAKELASIVQSTNEEGKKVDNPRQSALLNSFNLLSLSKVDPLPENKIVKFVEVLSKEASSKKISLSPLFSAVAANCITNNDIKNSEVFHDKMRKLTHGLATRSPGKDKSLLFGTLERATFAMQILMCLTPKQRSLKVVEDYHNQLLGDLQKLSEGNFEVVVKAKLNRDYGNIEFGAKASMPSAQTNPVTTRNTMVGPAYGGGYGVEQNQNQRSQPQTSQVKKEEPIKQQPVVQQKKDLDNYDMKGFSIQGGLPKNQSVNIQVVAPQVTSQEKNKLGTRQYGDVNFSSMASFKTGNFGSSIRKQNTLLKEEIFKEKEKNEVAQPAQSVVTSTQKQPSSDTKKTTDKEAIQHNFLVMLKEKAERILAISKKNVDELSSEDKILISIDEQYTLALYALTNQEVMGIRTDTLSASRVRSEDEVEDIKKNIAEKQNKIMNDDLYEKKEVVGNKNNEKNIADILNKDLKDLTEDDKELIMGLKDNLLKNTLSTSSVLGDKTPKERKEIKDKLFDKVCYISISELQKKEQTTTVSSATVKPGKQEVEKSN